MKMLRLPLAMLLCFFTFAPLLADPPDNLLGPRYAVDGTNPDGSKYRGTVTVRYEQKSDRYRVTWTVGNDTIQGNGRLSQHEGAFEVTYNGGIAVYALQERGIWDGIWGKNLNNLNGKEVWRPQ